MRNLRSLLALLLAAAVLVLCALLPRAAAWRQDKASLGQIQFAPIQDVQLEFAQNDMTMSETVAILGKYRESVDIPEDLASLSAARVETIAASAAQRYQKSVVQMGEAGKGMLLSRQCLLVYGSDGSSNIYWAVNYGSYQSSQVFNLIIDDRTGTVCSLEYSDPELEYTRADMEQVLGSFAELYLTGLGEGFFDFTAEALLKGAESAADGSYLASEIRWEDARYGDCHITFFVSKTGFYTYLY